MSQPRPKELFEILVREHARELDVFLRSAVADPAQADDLFQDTLLVAWRRIGDFDRRRPFGPWLRGIAAKLVLSTRSNPRGRTVVDEERVLEVLERRCAELHELPGDTMDERLRVLDECLSGLPERMRTALDLRYARGENSDGLAQHMRTTAANARKILQRARDRLGDCFRRRLTGVVLKGDSL